MNTDKKVKRERLTPESKFIKSRRELEKAVEMVCTKFAKAKDFKKAQEISDNFVKLYRELDLLEAIFGGE